MRSARTVAWLLIGGVHVQVIIYQVMSQNLDTVRPSRHQTLQSQTTFSDYTEVCSLANGWLWLQKAWYVQKLLPVLLHHRAYIPGLL